MCAKMNFTLHHNIVIGEVKPYENISLDDIEMLRDFVKESNLSHFAFIDHRPKNTSIDPLVYIYIREHIPNLCIFALVTQSYMSLRLYACESLFMGEIENQVFYDLDKAIIWAEERLERKTIQYMAG